MHFQPYIAFFILFEQFLYSSDRSSLTQTEILKPEEFEFSDVEEINLGPVILMVFLLAVAIDWTVGRYRTHPYRRRIGWAHLVTFMIFMAIIYTHHASLEFNEEGPVYENDGDEDTEENFLFYLFVLLVFICGLASDWCFSCSTKKPELPNEIATDTEGEAPNSLERETENLLDAESTEISVDVQSTTDCIGPITAVSLETEYLPTDSDTRPGSVNLLETEYPSEELDTATNRDDSADEFESAQSTESASIYTTPTLPQSLTPAHPAQKEALAERAETGSVDASQELPDSVRQTSPISLDDFEFKRWLGSGSFGQVFQAEQKNTGKMLAIKRINKIESSENDMIEKVFLERDILRIARDSRDPFLVNLFCAFQSEHQVYLAMEFVGGGTLQYHLKYGALPHSKTLFYSACIVQGIKFLHDHGIVHRDLKPDNIVLDSAGYAKVTDFGLCKTGIDCTSEMTGRYGNSFYCAPEILKEESYNRTVDWWSLGVIIYEMAVGEMPFDGDDEDELCDAIINTEPDYPTLLNGKTALIIRKLLYKNPKFRLGSARNDGEEVQNFCYFETIDWKALMDKRLKAPFQPGNNFGVSKRRGGRVTTPLYFIHPTDPTVQAAFSTFDELPVDIP
ncbi:serine/threonine-protein kinase N1-like [Xenopus tropicalis]|uniref:Serine/threonine-protein kinase N1-like n=1 Tax=Xenopus tropicalis TaxID=8364 RepID=A0A8J1J2L8_XENTR|nr:serine/threonine-protein kinase N1-like [Xenopus tropicalis]